jgi:hypothetical protein
MVPVGRETGIKARKAWGTGSPIARRQEGKNAEQLDVFGEDDAEAGRRSGGRCGEGGDTQACEDRGTESFQSMITLPRSTQST